MRRYRNRIMIVFLCMLWIMVGCRPTEEAVISVEPAVSVYVQNEADPVSNNTLQKSDVALRDVTVYGAEPGTFLTEERVVAFTEAGEVQLHFYRMQGSYGYSIAFDTELFCIDLDESVDRIYINGANSPDQSEAILYISENMEYALEELADKIVLECKQECIVEEVTVGEEEYTATWITYNEVTERGKRNVEYYLVGYEDRVLEIQLICADEIEKTYYDQLQIIMSTIRLDSIAAG